MREENLESSRTALFKDDRDEDWAAIIVSVVIVTVIMLINSNV